MCDALEIGLCTLTKRQKYEQYLQKSEAILTKIKIKNHLTAGIA